jgi:HAD superfamily hydrolase (TIGR01549 family)
MAEAGRVRTRAMEMARRFIDNYDVILLDMHKTFMFQGDRFDDVDAIQATYEEIGGTVLHGALAGRVVSEAVCWGLGLYRAGQRRERFPLLPEMLRQVPEAVGLPEEETQRLVQVAALHEVGIIPSSYVDLLHALRRTHRLGLVSDIFAPSDIYRKAFDQAGITDLFEALVWSSDVGPVKPCSRIFHHALRVFDMPLDRVVYVGDSYRRDVVGARNAGIASVWISENPAPSEDAVCQPDLIVRDLGELLTC